MKKADSPSNIIRAAAAKVGAHSVKAIAEMTGIKRTTMQRRMENISTFTVGELSALMAYAGMLQSISDCLLRVITSGRWS